MRSKERIIKFFGRWIELICTNR
uniref:Uncharacterized protein n=1 Tax=Rhizophora mucronata TaxID=61149 RepID=A0A2P2PPK1_RHIMU